MTQAFAQGAPDYLFGSNVQLDYTAPLDGATFKAYKLLVKHPLYGKVVPWEIEYKDFRGGFRQFGSLEDVGNCVSTSTLQHTFPDYMTLPQLVGTTTLTGANISTGYFSCWSKRYSILFIGGGTEANLAIYDDSDSAVPVANTYNPTGNISGLKEIIIGGAGTAPRLAILSTGAAIDICTWAAHALTSAGAMNAATNPGWGLMMTPLNATTPGTQGALIYAGTTLSYLPSSAAIGDAPTNTLTGINGGGVDLGIFKPKNMPYLRAFWLWPNQNQTVSMFGTIAPAPAMVWHTNMEGTDPLPVPFPLPYVLWAVIVGDELWATDGHTIYAWDGDTFRNLGIFRERSSNTNLTCRGLGENNGIGYALNYQTDRIERYWPKLNSWLPISGALISGSSVAASSTGPLIFSSKEIEYTDRLPVSRNRGSIYQLGYGGNNVANYFYQSPGDNNPFYEKGASFEPSGTATGPVTYLPGLAGYPSIFAEIDASQADPTSGGTDATQAYITYDLSNQPAGTSPALSLSSPLSLTIFANDPIAKRYRNWDDNMEAWNRFQWKVTTAQSTAAATKTTNALPFTLRGFSFLDRVVRSPREIRGKGWER